MRCGCGSDAQPSVPDFEVSHHYAAPSFANFGIVKDTSNVLNLVWLWFRSPHDEFAAEMMPDF